MIYAEHEITGIIATAIGFMGGLTLLLAGILALVNKRFYVLEDRRIAQLVAMLPRTNCGACGFAGCHAFAEALVAHQALPAQCTISPLDAKQRIATFLGVDTGDTTRKVARLACAGSSNVARNQADYVGLASCQAATQVSGGAKVCLWGCLGFGDCEAACDFDAIHMSPLGLPEVDEQRCTACGDCVTACPKDLFSLQPADHRLWVACNNREAGDALTQMCEVACTACGRCAMDTPAAIVMRDNLPQIDYAILSATLEPIQRCPTGAIVWLNDDNSITKGRDSKKIIRRTPLPVIGT